VITNLGNRDAEPTLPLLGVSDPKSDMPAVRDLDDRCGKDGLWSRGLPEHACTKHDRSERLIRILRSAPLSVKKVLRIA